MKRTSDSSKVRRELYARWKAADDAIQELIARGTKSSTHSGGSGSQSYTALDLKDLVAERDKLAHQIAVIDNNARPKIQRVNVRFNG